MTFRESVGRRVVQKSDYQSDGMKSSHIGAGKVASPTVARGQAHYMIQDEHLAYFQE